MLVVTTNIAVSQEINFKFNPPDTTYKEILRTKKVTIVNGKKQKEDEIKVTTKYDIKKVASGYELKQSPLAISSKRDGKMFHNPIFMFLTNIPTKGEIDKNGNLTHVIGYEHIIPRAQTELPKEVVESMMLVANEEAMINKAKAEWNARISEFSGNTFHLGDMLSAQGKFPLPNGEVLTFFSVIKIADTLEFMGNKCIKITFHNSSSPEELASILGYSQDDLKEVFDVNANSDISTQIKLSGDGYRIIDPETMLIFEEKTFRCVEMKDEQIGNESKIITTLETKEYEYQY
ncbi:hypothetical protein D9V86_04740 [Bacteroidetes/Chlorobi group bacterium ChocPot_Mid]|jgi:hypothetical protein|nr:MAG: hypothetical protein D9V86_04740 [Bacteroidetes/Chlorobi group bacterium ChocPot_Mid]